MPPQSPLDIFKRLPKTNCGECGEATCLAFASAVIKKNNQLKQCPYLESDVIEQLSRQVSTQMTSEEKQQQRLEKLKKQLREVDLRSRADILGGRFSDGRLAINCLGKEFSVDSKGNLASQCHTHFWFAIPFLSYILYGKGLELSGEWTTFRNLKDGLTWDPFFNEQCPMKLKKLADTHSELFANLISAFGATTGEAYHGSDVSVILYPFPKVPMMVCYWRPEEDLQSDLRLFFDSTADQNLSTEAVFGLGTGIVRMLEKITEKHRG